MPTERGRKPVLVAGATGRFGGLAGILRPRRLADSRLATSG
jgi:hypothetical protein